MSPSFRLASVALAAAAAIGPALTGCDTPGGGTPAASAAASGASTGTAAVAAARPAPPALVAAAFNDAVARAGDRLIDEAQSALGGAPRELVIDPLIDGSTGQQTAGTVQMGEQLTTLIKARSPSWNVRPLSRDALAKGPLLLIGTLTAINTKPGATDPADAFRVCLSLSDLKTGRILAKQVDRATVATVNAEPVAFYRDSPTWPRDKTVAAYVKSCQGSGKGDAVDPAYVARLPAEAVLNDAGTAYNAKKLGEANRLYREAATLAEPDDLRVLNGLYLTNWKLGRRKDATDAFDKIVGAGLDSRQLPIKLLFAPSSTNLLPIADLQSQYAIWLREVAQQVDKRQGCMKIVGHTSRTGVAAVNESLSQRRAAAIEQALERHSKRLAPRLAAEGVGSRENLIGLGTDDARDALDRRVEFRVVDCTVPPKT